MFPQWIEQIQLYQTITMYSSLTCVPCDVPKTTCMHTVQFYILVPWN